MKATVRASMVQGVNLTPQLLQSIRLLQLTAPQLQGYRSPRNGAPGGNGNGSTSNDDGIDNLPRRQREIFGALGAGRTTKQIAADLGISVKTVETHRARMMETLGCRNAGELLRVAMRHHDRP